MSSGESTSRLQVMLCAAIAAVGLSSAVHAQPAFDKAFFPETIGPGSISTLVFTIANFSDVPVTDMAFTDVLPAGVTIATPASAATTCGDEAVVVAPDGGGTITFSDGELPATPPSEEGVECQVTVNVTSGTVGTHTNTSGDLTSDAGNSGPATADLTVDAGRPGFSKGFSPDMVVLGARSRLTFTIDNGANDSRAFALSFSDSLPSGLEIAGPPLAVNDCGGTLTALDGGTTISLFSQEGIAAGASCTVSLDVVATAIGTLENVSGDLTSSIQGPPVPSGKAGAVLEATTSRLSLVKSFLDDPLPAGSSGILRFRISNQDRDDEATGITFTDDLDATLAGLAAVPPLPTDPCGVGSSLTGTSLLTLTGGELPAGDSCTFDVTVQVPAAAATGVYPNTTSSVTGEVGGEEVTGDPATDVLVVAPVPILTKVFLTDPVGAGGTVDLEFTITNTSSTASATDIAFIDVMPDVLPTAASLPSPGFCGSGATAVFDPDNFNGPTLTVFGASLDPGASCTFSVTLDVAAGASQTVENVTSAITAIVDDAEVTGAPATDTLTIAAPPRLSKEFTDDPVDAGDTVTLELTLSHDELAPGDATDIAFTDDLDAALAGLTAVGLPQNDVCGASSSISGTTLLTFTGGTLTPGESCTFQITLQVPAGALPGTYTNTTGAVTATVAGLAATGVPASDVLRIQGLEASKEFLDDPAIPGGTVTLSFTLVNQRSDLAVTDIAFSDDLGAVVPGLAAVGLPQADVCGAGSQVAGTSVVALSGGSLPAGGTCTFTVTLQVPGDAADGIFTNITSAVTGTYEGVSVASDPARDDLEISATRLTFDKSFTDDPVAPGDTATLELTITNTDAIRPVTDIAFSDDLDAVLPGLEAVGLPQTDVCGAGSQVAGTSLLTLTGGNLSPGGSCTFAVTLQVPSDAPGGPFVNTTSEITGVIEGLAVRGEPATDTLRVTGSFTPVALAVDPEPVASDGNEVFEPGEQVEVAPTWRNDEAELQLIEGVASSFTGPTGPTYTLVVDEADYGNVASGATASCRDTGRCYRMEVSPAGVPRPATHWDAAFEEILAGGTDKTWTLHVGSSFLDMPTTNPFYRFVETLLHHELAMSCTDDEFCPSGMHTREQMAMSLLLALMGPGFEPPPCVEGQQTFADVPFDDPFCPWIEELADRGITSGCGGDNYCPDASVTRAQMAVLLLRTLEGEDHVPPPCSGVFSDVTCPSTFAAWIEDLFARGITGGCGVDPPAYCPDAAVTRAQMAVFLVRTFELVLYGP